MCQVKLQTINETCAVCNEVCEGLDNGHDMSLWPDGVFLGDSWVCSDCIPDGHKFGLANTSNEHLEYLRSLK